MFLFSVDFGVNCPGKGKLWEAGQSLKVVMHNLITKDDALASC